MSNANLEQLAQQHGDIQVLPTTFAQLRFWLLDQIGDEGGAFTIPMALRLKGALDVDALEAALNLIVSRHEALRTIFALDGEEPMQVVIPSLAVVLERIDVRNLSTAERDQAIAERADANANLKFDLNAGPLFRAAVMQVADDEYVLYLALHHIVGDGWSIGVLYSELERAYTAIRDGVKPSLTELPLQYPDYAVWQRRAMQGGAATRQLAYWTEQLRTPPTLELSTDRPRPAHQTMNGGKRELLIDGATVESMRALARSEGATPYMAFLTAFSTLLHRYTGQTDLVVGSITSGRSRAEVEPLIGLFVNTLAVRVNAEGNPSFKDLLQRVVTTTTTAYANQDVPFEQVIDAVQPTRDRSRSPIFQVAFQLLEGLGRDLQLPGIAVSRVRGNKDTTKFDLTLMLHAAPGNGLRAVMEYNSDLFDVETVDRMLAHYSVLVKSIARNPQLPIAQLDVLSADERDLLLAVSRGPQFEHAPTCVHTLVELQAQATPNAVAISGADATLSYAELDAEANRLASYMQSVGVKPGAPVGICLPRDTSMIVALLATLKTGAHYVPLDPDYPAERLAFILQDSSAAVVISKSLLVERVPATDARVVLLDTEYATIAAEPTTRIASNVTPESLAYVLHTSGSTGKPKGVMIPHRAVTNFLRSMQLRPGLAATDAIVAVTTLSFDIAGLELWLPLITGARVVIAPRSVAVDGHALLQLVNDTAQAVAAQGGRVMLQATPATWRLLLDAGWNGTDGLRMLCGGEAWSADLAAALLPRGESLWNVYGPTETTIWSSVARVDQANEVLLGQPIHNTTLLVLDANGGLTLPGVAGELYIGGDGVAHGYLNRPDLTAEKFVADRYSLTPGARLYRTGDLVRRRQNGALEYLSRVDQQIKLRGFRIELGEIEGALAAQPDVAQAAVTLWQHAGNAQLVAYLVARDSANPPSPDVLRHTLRRSLPEFMVPQQYVMMSSFPLTPNGKVDRRALPEPTVADAPARTIVAPRTQLETQIAEVWADVLGIETISVDDDFFELGGHSLLAMRVIARLNNALPVRMTIGTLFESRSVAGLAAYVVEHLAIAESDTADDELAAMLAELDAMSDEDAAAMLSRDGGTAA